MLVATGLAAWALRGGRAATWLGASGAIVGCGFGGFAALRVLVGSTSEALRLPWSIPLATFSVGIDPLSAFFLLPTFGLSALAACYGAGAMRPVSSRRSAGASWLWFNLLVASMAMVLAARNAILFLFAWELMTLASFFLVTFHHDRPEVRRAGRIYLVATHVGTAFLLVFFLMLGDAHGSLDFDRFGNAGSPQAAAGILFLLAVLGFGTKAGFMPLHLWLPEAHPAAPAHVSAVMSGVMIKLGIYGVIRSLSYLGPPPPWWGWLLVLIGLVSGVLGVLYALAQHELKRLLAYHSIENIGIITCGLGLGLLGVSYQQSFLAVLGFAGALLHVLNHAVFKGLLFLGAGAVLHGAHTADIERLGGLWKRMPWTGAAFLIGATAISGLPPLNGFVSEFLLYLGSFRTAATLHTNAALVGVAAIAGLALIGGLAAACFAKAFGVAFLGNPRSAAAGEAREPGWLLQAPMLLLAAACLVIGLASPWILMALGPVIPVAAAIPPGGVHEELAAASAVLLKITMVATLFLLLVLTIAGSRKLLLAGRPVGESVTWDCGYALPTPRMQYTASSFAQPILELFAPMLGTRVSSLKPFGTFPERASHATSTPDSFRERVFRPVFQEIERRLAHLRRIQEGRVQVYVLYIALTLLALLLYQFLVNP